MISTRFDFEESFHKQMKMGAVDRSISMRDFIVSAVSKELGLKVSTPPVKKIEVDRSTSIPLEQAKKEVKDLRLNEKTTACPKCGEEVPAQDFLNHVKNCKGK